MPDANSALQKALDGLTTAISEMVNLEIKTFVGVEAVEPPAERPAKPPTVYTCINLLQGDITTMIPDNFFSKENAALKEFHSDKERLAQAIIDKNLNQLVAAAKAISDAMKS